MNSLEIYVDETDHPTHAGTLYVHRRGRAQSASFSYNSSYIATPDAWAIDPALTLQTGAFQTPNGRALFGALTDCAPDRWGRTLVERREKRLAASQGRTARTLCELDVLIGVRDDLRQGALRFAALNTDAPFLAEDSDGVPALTDLSALLDLAAKAESNTADLPDLQRLVHVGSSLGGARPKAHVRSPDGALAIAKFPSANHDTWNVMAWEKVALDLAARCGIRVPNSTLLNLAGRSVLVIERFDRPHHRRVGYMSAMSMLEAADGDQRSYIEIAEILEQRSDRTTQELHELWIRAAFSMLISNTDDHLRNHGFLHRRADIWNLSPAFDLNPSPEPGPPLLSTSIDGTAEPATPAMLLAVAPLFRLTDAHARDELRRIAAATAQWQQSAAQHGLNARERGEMSPAFDMIAAATAV